MKARGLTLAAVTGLLLLALGCCEEKKTKRAAAPEPAKKEKAPTLLPKKRAVRETPVTRPEKKPEDTRPVELRGAWLHARNCKTKAEADKMLARAESANLNALFVLIFYWRGTAGYVTDMVPMLDGVEEGFDPLGYLIEQGHAKGIEIHAWYVNGAYGWGSGEGILEQRPEWRTADISGRRTDWYDLCNEEVRRWQSDLMIDCLRRYDIDSLHFDYIRFRGSNVCTCPVCQAAAKRDAGIDILGLCYRELPACGQTGGNPLAEPTTARVLAQFDDGVPAIAVNELGAGKVLLFNWHIARWCPMAITTFAKRFLDSCGVKQGDQLLVLDSDINAKKYSRYFKDGKQFAEGMGYKVKKVKDEGLAKLPEKAVVVLPMFYMMTDEISQNLLEHVKGGGVAVFMDGPVYALRQFAAARELLGFQRMGRYFSREVILSATEPVSDMLPSSKRTVSPEKQREQLARWTQWRKDQITKLVRDVYERTKREKPGAMVTAAVFRTKDGSHRALQDWPRWHRERICDYLIPMSYVATPEQLDGQFAWWEEMDPTLERIIPAVGAFKLTKGRSTAEAAAEISKQVEVCRRHKAHGVVMFNLEGIPDEVAAELGRSVFPGKARPYRPPAAK